MFSWKFKNRITQGTFVKISKVKNQEPRTFAKNKIYSISEALASCDEELKY